MIGAKPLQVLMIYFLVDLILYQVLRYMCIIVFAGDLQRIIAFVVHYILKQQIAFFRIRLFAQLLRQKHIHNFKPVIFRSEMEDILAYVISLVQFSELIFCNKLSHHRIPKNSRDS